MKSNYFRQNRYTVLYSIVVGIFLLILSGCGGGSSGGTTSGDSTIPPVLVKEVTLSGVIQKGPMINGQVIVQPVSEKGVFLEKKWVADIDDKGGYQMTFEQMLFASLSAKGLFYNEYTGKISLEAVELYALQDLRSISSEKKVNVNLFTSLVYKRVLYLMNQGSTYDEAKKQARTELERLLNVPQNVDLAALDIYDMTGDLKQENINLLLFSATLMKVIAEEDVEKTQLGYVPGTTTGALQSSIGKLLGDFEDDGKFNAGASSLFAAMSGSDVADVVGRVEDNLDIDTEAKIPGWLQGGDAAITIDKFALSSVIVNSIERPYSNETRVFIAASGDNVKLKFRYETTRDENIAYNLRIVAFAGTESLVVKSDIAVDPSTTDLDIYVDLDETLRTFLNQAYANGLDITFKAITDVLPTNSLLYVSKSAGDMPEFVPLSDKLVVNTTELPITLATNFVAKANDQCTIEQWSTSPDAPSYAMYDMRVEWQPSLSWSTTEASLNDGCVGLIYDANSHTYKPILTGSSQVEFPENATISRSVDDITLTTTIGLSGVKYYINADGTIENNASSGTVFENVMIGVVKLPSTITSHLNVTTLDSAGNENSTGIIPISYDALLCKYIPKNISENWDDISLELVRDVSTGTIFDYYLHTKYLPFYIALENVGLRLNGDGLFISNATAQYIHKNAYSFLSNDVLFSKPIGTFDISIENNALKTDTPIMFEALNGKKIFFPQSTIDMQGFAATIIDGEIVPFSIDAGGTYLLGYNADCKQSSCSDGAPSYLAYAFPSSSSKVAADGSFMSVVDLSNKKIAWGSQQAEKSVFERAADSSGVMYVPGFTVSTNDPDQLTNVLMGSRNIQNDALGDIHPLNSDTFNKEGNGLFAGLNVGQLYLNTSGNNLLESLNGTNMTIQIGGITKQEMLLNNNASTKYYVRPSGITGVFNGTLAQADVTIYGYPMSFKRFAFRQVANRLDPETWIDGQVTVPGDGDFRVDFASLALDCTGALNSGLVEDPDCISSPTINCDQKLGLWKTNTDFISIAFTPRSSDICGEKDLKIGHLLDIKALGRPLGLTTVWTPEGKPKEAFVTGSSTNYLDAAENNTSSKGFAITLDKGSKLTDKGWYKFSGAFGLPFWGMKPVDFGLENEDDGLHRKKSMVMDKGEISETWDSATLQTLAKDKIFTASYQWGSTGLGFALPVKYKAEDAEKESIFLGQTKSADLGVMSAKAGINFIKPEETKISFGASADFAAMADIDIQIDLNDPKSIEQVDDLLSTFGIGGQPLHNTVGLVLDPLREAENYADKGLLIGMEELGLQALEKTVNGIPVDPFEQVSEIMVKIHTLPLKAVTMTEDFIMAHIDMYLMDVYMMLNEPLMQLESTVDQTTGQITEQISEEVNASIQLAIGKLAYVENQGFAKLDQLKAQLEDVNRTLGLINPADNWDIIDQKLKLILPQSSECTAEGLLANSDLLKPVDTLKQNLKKINDQLQAINLDTVRNFASLVEDKIDFDADDLINAFEKTQTVARSINSEITTAQGKVDDQIEQLCTKADDIRNEIKELVLKMDQFDPIKTKLQEYINKTYAVLNSDEITHARENVSKVKTYLAGLEFNMEPRTTEVNEIWQSFSTKMLLMQMETIQVDGQSIESMKGDLEDLLKKIPQPSADELREMVVTTILDSEPIQEVRETMNDAVSPVMDQVREVAVALISSANGVVYDLLAKLSAKANEVLASATSAVEALPIKSGKMDGYANISGDEVERVHIGAEWAVDTGKEDTSYTFNGALDMVRWSANGKAGCDGTDEGDGNMDVKISTRDIKMDLGGKKLSIDELYFGFTLANATPIGVNGGIESKAGFDFNQFRLYDMKLFAGVGSIETYLGATTAAIFDQYQLSVAFLLGRTCGKEIITALDPKVGKFITLPNNQFYGAYLRGGASFPIWNNGCALTVGISANLGMWYLVPGTYGGLIGGGAYGQALCIASLRGEVETLFEKSGDNVKYDGTGWGAAGVGWCSPSSWTSVAKSRRDSWCGTGDAQFGTHYNDGWTIDPPRTSAVH